MRRAKTEFMDFIRKIKLAAPEITSHQEQAIIEVLRSGNLVAGQQVRLFEKKLCQITHRKFAVMVSSGTAALIAAMKALKTGRGSVVIVPAFTFPAPALAAHFLGARVVFCDVDPATLNMSVKTLMPHIDKNVSLVVPIDQFGVPSPVDEIEEALKPYRIPVLVDAACSIGSTLNKKPCGSLGKMAIFSFHPRKIITTAEGGAVLTDNETLAKNILRFRNIGMENGEFISSGINLRPSEMGAAMGLYQLNQLDKIIKKRLDFGRRYKKLNVSFQKAPENTTVNNQTMAALLPAQVKENGRDNLRRYLADNGVESQVASYCIGLLPNLAKCFNTDYTQTPAASMAHKFGIALPLHNKLTNEDIDYVVCLVEKWLHKFAAKPGGIL